MIYPEHFEKKIGFDVIRNLIAEACVSDMGKDFVKKIRFSSNAAAIGRMHRQITEFRKIIDFGKPFPNSGYFDLRPELLRLKTEGSYISEEALFDLKSSLTVLQEILDFIKNTEPEEFPELQVLAGEVVFPGDILQQAAAIIDDKGRIKDNASPGLARIRREISSKERQVIAETRKAFVQAKKSGFLPEGAEITIRNGRAVIPVRASDKRAVKGFIHDESASGQTVFIEPVSSFEMNNEIVELENDERREIIKILTLFSETLRPGIPALLSAYRFLGLMDFIRAKALVGVKLNASSPVLRREKVLDLKKAVHPLLFLSHSKTGKGVVPQDISLNPDRRILIISGPNAGGKSVCMKTLGLLQYMFQCGVQIPASPNSELPLFDRFFIDIGDEQSLENDLSTYSSHLLNMKFFLKHANSNTLLLIDEFGTGTEPQLGAAIAEATLEQLAAKGAFGVITTHYTNLKLAADRIPGLTNGAMLFDTEKMQPLYLLKIGKPGSSFAFEIARKIGFPAYVLNRAKKKSGGKHLSFDKQLQQLEADKLAVTALKNELKEREEELTRLQKKYETLLGELEKNKKQIIKDARQEALEILNASNREIEKTIREIKEAKAEKGKTKALRQELEWKKKKLATEVDSRKQTKSASGEKKETAPGSLKPGDFVEIEDMDVVGELLSTEGKDAIVNVNNVKLTISLKKLSPTQKKPETAVKKSAKNSFAHELNEKMARFELTIDLRGKRADEALEQLQRYIDDALLLRIKEVSILHGKGYGILREVIRDYLKTVPEIERFGDAPVEFGGAGITKVVFR